MREVSLDMVGDTAAIQKALNHLTRAEALVDDPRASFHLRQAEQLLLTQDWASGSSTRVDLAEKPP